MASLFNKKLPPSCKYCVHGRVSVFGDEVMCAKKGITVSCDACRSYKYDPLKRQPNKVKISDNYTPEDFSL